MVMHVTNLKVALTYPTTITKTKKNFKRDLAFKVPNVDICMVKTLDKILIRCSQRRTCWSWHVGDHPNLIQSFKICNFCVQSLRHDRSTSAKSKNVHRLHLLTDLCVQTAANKNTGRIPGILWSNRNRSCQCVMMTAGLC